MKLESTSGNMVANLKTSIFAATVYIGMYSISFTDADRTTIMLLLSLEIFILNPNHNIIKEPSHTESCLVLSRREIFIFSF